MRHKILVVEDDHGLRDVLLRGLSEEGFDPVPAADGATALRLATDGIAAVVLDVQLPDADGRDVCQALRGNGFGAPVIFLTARHRLADRLSWDDVSSFFDPDLMGSLPDVRVPNTSVE
ncbi:response regulator, partial [Streptomyces sp. NPDC048279]|uniref:response regulator transcription factor n=1 Tax=Streptomyces sp. NPDC048279 TaxID=3154714 RepID=UPI003428D4D5